MNSKKAENNLVVSRLPIIEDYSVCPFCKKSLGTEIITCRFHFNDIYRYTMKRLKKCYYCELYYGTPSMLLMFNQRRSIESQLRINNAKTEKTKNKLMNRYPDIWIESFAVNGESKQEIKKKSIDQSGIPSKKDPPLLSTDNIRDATNYDNSIVDIPRVSTAKRISRIYLFPFAINVCPICNRSLHPEYVYFEPIDDRRAVRITGLFCHNCDALFTSDSKLSKMSKHILQQKKILDERYSVKNDTEYPGRIRRTHPSVIYQFWLVREGELVVCSIVSDYHDVSYYERRYLYNSDVALELLQAENTVMLYGNTYTIVRKGSFVPYESHNSMQSIRNGIKKDLPELNSKSIVHIYNGRLRCQDIHILRDYCGIIEVNNQKTRFYIQYCFNCLKYYIKLCDYNDYLLRFGFFPFVTEDTDLPSRNRFQNRNDKSTLFKLGYSVSEAVGLTSSQRKNILIYALEAGILDKRRIVDHLEMLITDSRNRFDRTLAVAKWSEDKEFVLNYKLDNHPHVVIAKLIRLR